MRPQRKHHVDALDYPDNLKVIGQSEEPGRIMEARQTGTPFAVSRPGGPVANAPHPSERSRRWGVVLAGGDGVRLRPLARLISGDDRPKQFCALLNAQTLLERSLLRVERSIPRDRIAVSLTCQHQAWYNLESSLRPEQRIVQPMNRGTAPPIVHSLLSIAALDDQAIVAVFPSDHHFANEAAFDAEIDAGFAAAAKHPDVVMLLGANADRPETGYGWIELGEPVEQHLSLFEVRAFREKPSVTVAKRLLRKGAVWNTFVMVGSVHAFLQIIRASLFDVVSVLQEGPLWDGNETRIEDSAYHRMVTVDFSRRVLCAAVERLLVKRLGPVGWSDLGDPERAVAAIGSDGDLPHWALEWREMAPQQPVRSDRRGAYIDLSQTATA
jgi:mannose-1-phosphate guanylyltransferase